MNTSKQKTEEIKPEEIVDVQSEQAEGMQELELLRGQLEECTNRWKRALADYQNLQKRIEDDKRDFVRFAAKNFIMNLLPVIDDLEKASAHIKDKGLELTLKKFEKILKQEGVEKMVVLGEEYNVETMEAISVIEGEKDNRVIQVLTDGYIMHGAILRPAQVVVSKKKE